MHMRLGDIHIGAIALAIMGRGNGAATKGLIIENLLL